MTQYWIVFGLHLVFYFVLCHLIAFFDLRSKQHTAQLPVLRGVQQPVAAQYFSATFWYLLQRWIEFLYPGFSLWIVFSTLGANVFFNHDKSFLTQVGEYNAFVFPAIALIGIPTIIVRHFLGHRIGLRLCLYPEFAVTTDRLYYRFFVHWHSVKWSEIYAIKPINNSFGRACAYTVYLRSAVGLPTYPLWQVWKRTKTATLIVSCLLPNALTLKDLIERHYRQHAEQTHQSIYPSTTVTLPEENPATT